MMYGTLFMMAGAYTLAKNGHVRGDVLYGFFRPRTQATLDLILYILFFLPGIVALTWAGWTYRQRVAGDPRADLLGRRRCRCTRSSSSSRWPAACCCCRASSRSCAASSASATAQWPSREQDVEEVDVDKLKEMVHVKDEDIAALDKYVAREARSTPVKIRKELWFGFILMALIIAGTAVMLLSRRARSPTATSA